MQADRKYYLVEKLVAAFNAGSLVRNAEYQRGEAWSELQKAAFIDSLFRAYPIPALFLYEIQSPGLDDTPVTKYEIVDGQQRLTALRDFSAGKLKLQPVGEASRLRLPKTIAERPAPWAAKYYAELSSDLRTSFNKTEITVFVISNGTPSDEIRDLFIRLQSGTALSRQQIRDAWPGNLGPFIEHLAGKLNRRPAVDLFDQVDKRGQRMEDEEARDLRVPDRQLCAQLLRIFVDRERDPYVYPSVSSNDLDALYHELTDFDAEGPTAKKFVASLNDATEVFRKARALRDNTKTKFRRLDVSAAMMFLQDASKNALFKLDKSALAQRIADADAQARPAGKSTRGKTLEAFYSWWRENVARDVGIRLDERRAFEDAHKSAIRERDQEKCRLCGLAVGEADAEYDHWPVPWRDGGRTEIDNGRLVHKGCHPRGRPKASG